MPRSVLSVLCLAVLVLLFARPAAAYLDPASGSMILQVVVAAVAAVAITLKAFWHRIRSLFGGAKPDAEDVDREP